MKTSIHEKEIEATKKPSGTTLLALSMPYCDGISDKKVTCEAVDPSTNKGADGSPHSGIGGEPS